MSGNVLRQASSIGTLGIISPKQFKNNQFLNFLATGSINKAGDGSLTSPTPTPPASRANAAFGTPLFRQRQNTRVSKGKGVGKVEKKRLGSGLFLG